MHQLSSSLPLFSVHRKEVNLATEDFLGSAFRLISKKRKLIFFYVCEKK